MSFSPLLSSQRNFFASHATKDIAFRKNSLIKLKEALNTYESDLLTALQKDLRKNTYEAYTAEIGFVIHEIEYHIKHLSKWTRPEKVRTSLFNQLGTSHIYREPYGTALIISPWNYPVQLLFAPLVGAISAGNCAVLKPSEIAPATAIVIQKLIESVFDKRYIAVVEGGVPETTDLLKEKFDYIFYTGSTHVGRIIMESAAKHLTPVTLELGGKSPTIVDKSANIPVTARRIVLAKTMNSGQICTSPDYVFVHEKVKDIFIKNVQEALLSFYGKNIQQSPDFARIINKQHHKRLTSHLEKATILHGGMYDADDLFIEPTLVAGDWESPLMQEEIFGPILPIFSYHKSNEIIKAINAHPKPLALYLYAEDKDLQQKVITETSSGGVAINDSVMQVASDTLPFGGVGESGMGAYHGRHSFETFSHQKSVLSRSTFIDPRLKYPPYPSNLAFIKQLLKLL